MRHRIFPVRSTYTFLLAVILLINILIGSLIVTDYGESWDEDWSYDLANRSLAAYTSGMRMGVEEDKGPAYFMLALLGADALRAVWGNVSAIEAWHFMHFLSFLMGIYFLHQICIRYMSQEGALGAVLLFNTQPLLWGHAWINPKDLPFMAFFLGSVVLGMEMVELVDVEEPVVPPASRERTSMLIRMDLHQLSCRRRALLIGMATFFLALLLVLVLADRAIQSWFAAVVTSLYAEGDASAIGWIFSRLAENKSSVPADLYVRKMLALYRRLVDGYIVLAPVIWLACAAILLPQTRQRFWQRELLPFISAALGSLLNPRILLASLFLGFASAIRTLGPASGLLVAFYGLAKSGRKMVPRLLMHFILAGLVTFALWPGLWSSPLRGYLNALREASYYTWGGTLRFAGVDYQPGGQPRSYLPVLLALQFTEPALVLFLLGFSLAFRDFKRKRERRPELALAGLWFLAPFAAAVTLMPIMYDNFRQFLFIVPPLFIFVGMGIQNVFEWLQRLAERTMGATTAMRTVVITSILAVMLLPGLYWDVNLHPYQYVYYNQMVGGVDGAFRRYEMDYWTTSYKEAAEYLNANAPASARIGVWGADQIVKRYAREDMVITDFREPVSMLDYAVIYTRLDKDLELYPEAPVVFQVGRDGAIFTVVKRLGGDQP